MVTGRFSCLCCVVLVFGVIRSPEACCADEFRIRVYSLPGGGESNKSFVSELRVYIPVEEPGVVAANLPDSTESAEVVGFGYKGLRLVSEEPIRLKSSGNKTDDAPEEVVVRVPKSISKENILADGNSQQEVGSSGQNIHMLTSEAEGAMLIFVFYRTGKPVMTALISGLRDTKGDESVVLNVVVPKPPEPSLKLNMEVKYFYPEAPPCFPDLDWPIPCHKCGCR